MECSLLSQQLRRRLAVAALHLPQPVHAAGQEFRVPNPGAGGVDVGAQALIGQVGQLGVQVLTDVGEEGADFGVVHHAHQGHALTSGNTSAWRRMDTTACIRAKRPMVWSLLPVAWMMR